MAAIPKIVGVTSCGFLLRFGLSDNAALAGDEMKAAQPGERIGGQAGRDYEQKQWKLVAAQPGERIGGQAGLGYEQDKRQRVAAQ
jgi:hypothetical protein